MAWRLTRNRFQAPTLSIADKNKLALLANGGTSRICAAEKLADVVSPTLPTESNDPLKPSANERLSKLPSLDPSPVASAVEMATASELKLA